MSVALQWAPSGRSFVDHAPLTAVAAGNSTYTESSGAEIVVCTAHKLEFCSQCACNHSDANAASRRAAASKAAVQSAISSHGSHGFALVAPTLAGTSTER